MISAIVPIASRNAVGRWLNFVAEVFCICRHIFAVDWPIVTCRSFQGDWANARSKDIRQVPCHSFSGWIWILL